MEHYSFENVEFTYPEGEKKPFAIFPLQFIRASL